MPQTWLVLCTALFVRPRCTGIVLVHVSDVTARARTNAWMCTAREIQRGLSKGLKTPRCCFVKINCQLTLKQQLNKTPYTACTHVRRRTLVNATVVNGPTTCPQVAVRNARHSTAPLTKHRQSREHQSDVHFHSGPRSFDTADTIAFRNWPKYTHEKVWAKSIARRTRLGVTMHENKDAQSR